MAYTFGGAYQIRDFRTLGSHGFPYDTYYYTADELYTNVATGETVTDHVTYVSQDVRLIDNGDGSFTRYVSNKGHHVLYSDDGVVLARSSRHIELQRGVQLRRHALRPVRRLQGRAPLQLQGEGSQHRLLHRHCWRDRLSRKVTSRIGQPPSVLRWARVLRQTDRLPPRDGGASGSEANPTTGSFQLVGTNFHVRNSADPVGHGPHQVAVRVGTGAQQGAFLPCATGCVSTARQSTTSKTAPKGSRWRDSPGLMEAFRVLPPRAVGAGCSA